MNEELQTAIEAAVQERLPDREPEEVHEALALNAKDVDRLAKDLIEEVVGIVESEYE